MGEYNPHAPQNLGQEWVPIRDTDFTTSPVVNAFERGHGFTLLQSRTIRDARFYINDLASAVNWQAFLVAIYPKGAEDDVGPIRSVTIPVSTVNTTGGSGVIVVGPNAVSALAFPNDDKEILFNGAGTQAMGLFFDVDRYIQLLTGKRFLDVQFLFSAQSQNNTTGEAVGNSSSNSVELAYLNVASDANFNLAAYGQLTDGIYSDGTFGGITRTPISVASLGEVVDPLWGVNGVQPWRFSDLQRFQAAAGSRLFLLVGSNMLAGNSITWQYAALRVIFCEERRLATGGVMSRLGGSSPQQIGANVAALRVIQTQTVDPVIAAGEYTVTLSSSNVGSRLLPDQSRSAFPILNENRELYAMPLQPGVQVNIPVPVEDHLDETFTQEATPLLPQISLHGTSGAPLTEGHVYGRQAIAQVWGSVTATQEVQDNLAGGATSYPQVRFYARRWGNTTRPLVLDCPAIPASSVQILPSEFDALPALSVDGWKEVTLRFTTPPSMGTGTQPTWRWSATGEPAGSRWEILGAGAPAISGVPGNYLTLSPAQLGPATYGQPVSGSAINLGWINQFSPFVTGTADDQASDAVLIFAQDLAAPTLSITGASQALSQIGITCPPGVSPCCIPTALQYNRLTWTSYASLVATDTFTRSVANGWGTADTGGAWTMSGGAASDYSVSGTEGAISLNTVNVPRIGTLPLVVHDVDIRLDKIVLGGGITPAGAPITMGLIARSTSTITFYGARLVMATANTVALEIDKTVGGVRTSLATSATIPNVTPGGTAFSMRFQVIGNMLRAKAWDRQNGLATEPTGWLVTAFDGVLGASGAVGVRMNLETGNTNTPPITSAWDGLTVSRYSAIDASQSPAGGSFGYTELQRMDTITTDWKTIMKATNPLTAAFNDYEARVGVQSTYRIRGVDALGFAGPWSSTVAATIARPGITVGCLKNGHVLIFTTNEVQSGNSNLAYCPVWTEVGPEEGFVFPEASFNQFQAMYNRDFFTAFRPTERGGEQFERQLLVQVAAIPAPTLSDFTSLRDLAWGNTSYVCVRDDEGNRWFAAVVVPEGRVRRNRRLYLATAQIIEVTQTPSQVNA